MAPGKGWGSIADEALASRRAPTSSSGDIELLLQLNHGGQVDRQGQRQATLAEKRFARATANAAAAAARAAAAAARVLVGRRRRHARQRRRRQEPGRTTAGQRRRGGGRRQLAFGSFLHFTPRKSAQDATSAQTHLRPSVRGTMPPAVPSLAPPVTVGRTFFGTEGQFQLRHDTQSCSLGSGNLAAISYRG